MVYVPSKQLAFIEVPKTATRSISEVVYDAYGCESGKQDAHHSTLAQYKKKYPELQLAVCVMREPTERLLSAVNFMYQMTDPLSPYRADKTGFLENCRDRLMTAIQSKKYDETVLWAYPQYSFLGADVPLYIFDIGYAQGVCKFLGIDATLPRNNVSLRSIDLAEMHKVFTPEIVRSIYYVDFQMWDRVQSSTQTPFFVKSAKQCIEQIKNETANKIWRETPKWHSAYFGTTSP